MYFVHAPSFQRPCMCRTTIACAVHKKHPAHAQSSLGMHIVQSSEGSFLNDSLKFEMSSISVKKYILYKHILNI